MTAAGFGVDPSQQAEKKSLDFRVTLQPPEVFDDNHDFMAAVTTDHFTVALRGEANSFSDYVIFDSHGKRVTSPQMVTTFLIKYRDVARLLTQTNKNYLLFSGQLASDDLHVNTATPVLARNHQLPTSLIDSGLQGTKPNSSERYLGKDYFHNMGGKIIAAKLPELHVSPGEIIVLYNRELRTLVYFKTVSETGQSLSPAHWQKIVIDLDQPVKPGEPEWVNQYREENLGTIEKDLGLSIRCERKILSISDLQGKRLFSDAAVSYKIDPNDRKLIYYFPPAGDEVKIIRADQLQLAQTPVESKKLPFGNTSVKEVVFDPRGNFIFLLGNANKLYVVAKDTLEPIEIIPNVTSSINIDSTGSITFIDDQNRIRVAHTNLTSFPSGGLAKIRGLDRAKLAELQERLSQGLALPEDVEATAGSEAQSDGQIIEAAAAQVESYLRPHFDAADTLADLDRLRAQVGKLKADPNWATWPEVFNNVDGLLAAKESGIRTADLRRQISELKEALATQDITIPELMDAERQFEQLQSTRQQVRIPEIATRRAIDSQIAEILGTLAEFQTDLAQNAAEWINDSWRDIAQAIAEAQTVPELQAIENDQIYREFEEHQSYLDREQADGWRKTYREAVTARRSEIEQTIEREEEGQRIKLAETIEEANRILEEIERIVVTECATMEEFDRWRSSHPLLTRYRAKTLALPDEFRQEQEAKLSETLKRLRRDFEHRQQLSIPKEGGEVDFGQEKFPVYTEMQSVWQPKIEPLAEGSAYGQLVYIDTLGRRFEPKLGSVPANVHDPLTQQTIELTRREANVFFESLKRKVPGFNEKWVMTPFYKDQLSRMAKLLKLQLETQQGILILEGEAGTGKNVLIDMFSHFTNRETLTFACNFKTVKEELMYDFKFEAGKGSFTVDSPLVKAIQTPGTVIVFDEINTLDPGVLKMLNSLFDYRRCIFLPDGREIKAHSSVLIVGAMNPQNYLGVKPLSPEVKSRARIQFVEYPTETRPDGTLASDEAVVLSKYLEEFRGMSVEEFIQLWDYEINAQTTNGGDRFVTDKRTTAVNQLRHIIKTANRIREAYKAFRTGVSPDIIEFVFSIRETVAITTELNHSQTAQEAIKNVVLPKISDPAERTRVETIIDNT